MAQIKGASIDKNATNRPFIDILREKNNRPFVDVLKEEYDLGGKAAPTTNRPFIDVLEERNNLPKDAFVPEKLDVEFNRPVKADQKGYKFVDLSPETKAIAAQSATDRKDRTQAIQDKRDRIMELSRQGASKEELRAAGEGLTRETMENNPGKFGFMTSLVPKYKDVLEAGTGEDLTEVSQSRDAKRGKIAGTIVKNVAAYSLVTKAIEGTAIGAKLAGYLGGKVGSTAAGSFLAKQGVDLLADTIVQTPQEVYRAIDNNDSLGTFAKDSAKSRLIDIGINLAIGGAFEWFKKTKGIPDITDKVKQKVKGLPDDQRQILRDNLEPDIIKELGLDEGTTAKSFMDDQKKLGQDLGVEQSLKKYDKTETEMVGDFNQWRRDNFDGAFGKLPDEDMKALKQLYKEDTGIDIDVQITEAIDSATGGRPFIETVKANNSPIGDLSPETSIDALVKRAKNKIAITMPEAKPKSIMARWDTFKQEFTSDNLPFEQVGGTVEIKASNLNRVSGSIEHNILGEQTNMDGLPIGKSAGRIWEDIPEVNRQQVLEYSLHRHNVDRYQVDKAIFGEEITPDISKKVMADLEAQYPQVKEKADEVTGYFRNLMDEWGVKSGLVGEETSAMLKELYPNYVPTVRVKNAVNKLGTGDGKAVGKALQSAKGAKELANADVIVPLDTMMMAQTNRIIRNARKNELMLDLADVFEAGGASKHVFGIKSSSSPAVDTAVDIGKNLDEVAKKVGDKYLVNFYRKGEPFEMEVSEMVYKAMDKATSDGGLSKAADYLKKYGTSNMKALITDYNPLFAATNVMRDIPTALVYSDNPLKMVGKVPEATKQMLQNGDEYMRFKALGGTREGIIKADRGFSLPSTRADESMLAKAAKNHPIKKLKDINSFTETLPRFSEYLAVLESTGDPMLAIYKSAELTTDFSRYGKSAKQIDKVIPYFNASVQGVDKFFRSMKSNPLGTAAKAGAVITMPTMVLDYVNKDNSGYQSLPARERNLYFNIPYGDEGKFVRIAKSRELGVAFSSLMEWTLRKSRGEKVTGEEIASAIYENFTPSSLSNNVLTPAMEAWSQIQDPDAYSTNFWGGLVVPENQRQFSPGRQYDASSSGYAKAIGKQFNISPYVIDYLVDSYTGIIGDVARPLTSSEVTAGPISKKFINDPVVKNKNVSEFYDVLGEISTEAQDYNKDNDIPSRTVTKLEVKANDMKRFARDMSALRKKQKTEKDPEKIRELQKQLNAIAKRGIDLFDTKE